MSGKPIRLTPGAWNQIPLGINTVSGRSHRLEVYRYRAGGPGSVALMITYRAGCRSFSIYDARKWWSRAPMHWGERPLAIRRAHNKAALRLVAKAERIAKKLLARRYRRVP